jgi:hypothetical protein
MLRRAASAWLYPVLFCALAPASMNGQYIGIRTVSLTPLDRANFKFLPLPDGKRLRLAAGWTVNPDVEVAHEGFLGSKSVPKVDAKKTGLHLYVGAFNESWSKVWMEVQLTTPSERILAYWVHQSNQQ